jgi:signal transduction histidine kinase
VSASARRLLWLLVAPIALVAGAFVAHGWDMFLGGASVGGGVALMGAAAAMAAFEYRASHDPAAVFLGTGSAVLFLSYLAFGFVLRSRFSSLRGLAGSVVPDAGHLLPAYALLYGWLLFGLGLLLTRPWWERRGRPPLEARRLVLATLAALVAGDLLLWAFPPPLRISIGPDGPSFSLGVVAWLLAGAGLIVALTAAARLVPVAERTRWGLLLVAAIVGAAASVTPLLAQGDSTLARDAAQAWATLAPPLAGALTLGALLAARHAESSRVRRIDDRAQEVLSGRAEIASMIAHEVRGPVATVRGMAGTTLTYYERLTDDERREFLSMIEQESQRLLDTINQMSMALKIDAGTLTFNRKPVPLAPIVKTGAEAARRDDRLVAVVADEGILVSADPERLRESVRQLVDNAVKFSPADRPVTVRVVRRGPDAEIEIEDEGPGIPADQRERLFSKFPNWRPSGYEERPGTGLGLFISRGLVAEHSGTIVIEDGPHGGTMLRVRLPVVEGEAGGK